MSFPLEEPGADDQCCAISIAEGALPLVVRSRRSQIPEQQARYFVHKVSCLPIGEDVWAT